MWSKISTSAVEFYGAISAVDRTAGNKIFLFVESLTICITKVLEPSQISESGPFEELGNMQQDFADAVLTQIQGADQDCALLREKEQF